MNTPTSSNLNKSLLTPNSNINSSSSTPTSAPSSAGGKRRKNSNVTNKSFQQKLQTSSDVDPLDESFEPLDHTFES